MTWPLVFILLRRQETACTNEYRQRIWAEWPGSWYSTRWEGIGQHALINIGSVSPLDGYSARAEWPDSWYSSRREGRRQHALINMANVSLKCLVFIPPRRYVTACTDKYRVYILYIHGIHPRGGYLKKNDYYGYHNYSIYFKYHRYLFSIQYCIS